MERIAPMALNKTLRERRDQVRGLFNHGQDPNIGQKPLGRLEVLEADDHGVYMEVELSRTSYNDDLIELLKDGALGGGSFSFNTISEDWNRKKKIPERTVTELRLIEVSVVTFPAYFQTSVGIRNRRKFVPTPKQAADLATLRAFAQRPATPKRTLARRTGLTRTKSERQLNDEAIAKLKAAAARAESKARPRSKAVRLDRPRTAAPRRWW